MSRSEWWTIVTLLGSILTVLIINLVYQHFIWRDVVDMWKIILEHDLYANAKKLHMGDPTSGQHWQGLGGMQGGPGHIVQEGLRDEIKRGPRIC